MKPHIKIDITAGTLASMTVAQFEALQKNILSEGNWDSAVGLRVYGSGDHLGVIPEGDNTDSPGDRLDLIYIGIEKDGYTHS